MCIHISQKYKRAHALYTTMDLCLQLYAHGLLDALWLLCAYTAVQTITMHDYTTCFVHIGYIYLRLKIARYIIY